MRRNAILGISLIRRVLDAEALFARDLESLYSSEKFRRLTGEHRPHYQFDPAALLELIKAL